MAVLTGAAPLREQFDNTTSIVIPITTKLIPGLKSLNASAAGASIATATSIQVALMQNVSGAPVTPFPAWVNTASTFVIGSTANANREVLTVSAVVVTGGIATLTCTAATYAHPIGDPIQITENQGAAATSTFTFAAQALNSANRGMILELLDLLDRAYREGSATVA